jgi:DNA-entry nuclease
MKNNKFYKLLDSLLLVFVFASGTPQTIQPVAQAAKTTVKYDQSAQKKAHKIEHANAKTEKKIVSLDKKIAKLRQQLKKYTDNHVVESVSAAKLAELNYGGQDVITVNNNDPAFTSNDLSTARGAWQIYGNLDYLNRVTAANALLNQSLMPTAKREPLHVDPTGWHNKRIAGGWLYNRCHLIGYQLTGQNNNWQNLMTGTRQLNDPDMLRYENQVAAYLKESPAHYIRYRVTPVFRGNELLARGVEMEGQSTGSNAIHFNVYIFNVENGMVLNYDDGTSRVA